MWERKERVRFVIFAYTTGLARWTPFWWAVGCSLPSSGISCLYPEHIQLLTESYHKQKKSCRKRLASSGVNSCTTGMSCQLSLGASSSLPPPTPYLGAEDVVPLVAETSPTPVLALVEDGKVPLWGAPGPLLTIFAVFGEFREWILALETYSQEEGTEDVNVRGALG